MIDEKEYIEERAAIREFYGGQSRVAAERGAREDLDRLRARGGKILEGAPGQLPVCAVFCVQVVDEVGGDEW